MKARQILAVMLAVFVIPVFAETAYIPPNTPQAVITQAANGQELDYRSAGNGQPSTTNFKGGSWSVGKDGAVSAHFSSTKTANGSVTATKSNPVTFTNSYGAKATGTIKTQTTMPRTSALGNLFGVMMVGQVAMQHNANLQAQGVPQMIADGFYDGNWSQVAAGVGKMFDWTGVGGIYAQALYGNDVQQQVIDPLRQQALNQARQDFDNFQQQQKADPEKFAQYSVLKIIQNHPINADRSERTVLVPNIGNGQDGWFYVKDLGQSFTQKIGQGSKIDFTYTFPEGNMFVLIEYKIATKQDVIDFNNKQAPDPFKYMPSQAEFAQMMEQFLNQSNANNAAIRDLINALWANGNLDPNNTQTAVTGSAADNTFLTAPYTPVGSNQAEQTKITVAPDGTVTATTIPRPDLAANTSQAPTRQEVGKTNSISTGSTQTQAPKQQSSASAPDICAMNPNSLMCAEMGSADYEDIALPENKINLDFQPSDTFSTDGTCPAPKTINVLGSSFSLTYQPVCDFARGVRPMIILLGMVISMGMAYAAVKEL